MNRYVLFGMAAMALLIVAEPAQAMQDFHFVMRDSTAGPPYPSEPPVEVIIMHEKKGHEQEIDWVPHENISMSLQSPIPSDLPLRIEASDSGSGDAPGAESFFDIFTEVSTDDYPADSFFDLFVELLPPDIDKASPQLHKALAYPADSFFDLFVEIDIPDLGLDTLHLHGEIGPGQPLSFADVGVDNDCDSFFDIYIEVSTDGMINPELPLVTMTMTGTFVPEPATVVLLMLGAVGVLVMSRRGKK